MRGVGSRICLFLLIFGCFLAVLSKSDVKAESSIWAGNVNITETPISEASPNRGNYQCENVTYKSRYLHNELLVGDNLVYTSSTTETEGKTYADVCSVSNQQGTIGGGVWAPDGELTHAMPIVTTANYEAIGAPGGDTTVFVTPAPTYGLQYSINHNLPFIGKLSYKTYGSGFSKVKEKVWKIHTLSDFLSYSDNSIARIDTMSFSNNGRYGLIQLSKRSLARIDLQTKELTPFYNNTFSNSNGLYLSISNDGRYASYYRSGQLKVFDLANCTTSYAYGSWPSSGSLSNSGCTSSDYYSNVHASYPNLLFISRLRFSPNGAQLSVDVGVQDATFYWKRLLISPTDYVSQAQGYLAMGDSYSSGEGDTRGGDWYEPGTDEQGNKDTFAGRNLCHLSRRSYPYLMAVDLGYLVTNSTTPLADGLFHSVACSGAKIHNVIGLLGEKQDDGTPIDFAFTDNQYRYSDASFLKTWQPGATKQTNFVFDSLLPNADERPNMVPEVITISIGGNDAGFGQKLLSCLMPGTCEFAISEDSRAQVAIELASEKPNLVRTYKTLKDSAPEARIYAIGYPMFVQSASGTCASNVHLDEDERFFIASATQYFNLIIKSAAKEVGVNFVDIQDILAGTNLCSGATEDVVTVNGITAGNDISLSPVDSGIFKYGLCIVRECVGSETYHPNFRAQELYKTNILSSTSNLTSANPDPETNYTPTPSDYFGVKAISYTNYVNGFSLTEPEFARMKDLITGAIDYRNPTIGLSGLLPGSEAVIEIHSTPITLTTQTVDVNGNISAGVTIPDDLEGGYHEIHVTGVDIYGANVDYYQPILLAVSSDDFDGDGVLNDADSCPTIANIFIDVDSDGIDDACDPETTVTAPTPTDEDLQKGERSSETVAGDSEPVGQSNAQVLGAVTTDGELSKTGDTIMGSVILGIFVVILSLAMSKKQKQS